MTVLLITLYFIEIRKILIILPDFSITLNICPLKTLHFWGMTQDNSDVSAIQQHRTYLGTEPCYPAHLFQTSASVQRMAI